MVFYFLLMSRSLFRERSERPVEWVPEEIAPYGDRNTSHGKYSEIIDNEYGNRNVADIFLCPSR